MISGSPSNGSIVRTIRDNPGLHDFRGFSGQIAGGIVRVGQQVMVLPSGFTSTVKEIWTLDGTLPEAFSPQSVTLVLEHDIDIGRGDIFVDPHDLPGASSDLHAKICWMHPRPLQRGKKILAQAHDANGASRGDHNRASHQRLHT